MKNLPETVTVNLDELDADLLEGDAEYALAEYLFIYFGACVDSFDYEVADNGVITISDIEWDVDDEED